VESFDPADRERISANGFEYVQLTRLDKVFRMYENNDAAVAALDTTYTRHLAEVRREWTIGRAVS
jgi:hypothetical protein